MKKKAILVVISLLSLSVLWAQKKSQNIVPGAAKELGSPMPDIKIKDVNGKIYTTDDFKDSSHLFVFLFNPTCGHCIKMARLVNTNHQLFGQTPVLFMTPPEMFAYLPEFIKQTGINANSGIIIGVDSALFITQVYSYNTLPQINIYDKDRILVKVFHGDTPVDSLRAYIP